MIPSQPVVIHTVSESRNLKPKGRSTGLFAFSGQSILQEGTTVRGMHT